MRMHVQWSSGQSRQFGPTFAEDGTGMRSFGDVLGIIRSP